MFSSKKAGIKMKKENLKKIILILAIVLLVSIVLIISILKKEPKKTE